MKLYIKSKLIVLFLSIFIFNSSLYALNDPNSNLQLTQKEKVWLEQNPTIKLAIMSYWSKDEDGDNIHYKIIDLLSKYGGLNIVPVTFNNWDNGYKQAQMGDNVDGILGLNWSEKREQKDFFFTPTYDFTPCFLIVQEKNNTIKNFIDLKHNIVNLKNNSTTNDLIEQKLPSTKIIKFDYTDNMYKKLASSKANEAILIYDIEYKQLKKYKLKTVDTIYDKYGEISLGISHKNSELFSIIKKIWKIIPKEELINLRNKNKLNFSKDEITWLNKNIIVKYTYDPNYKPIEWTNEIYEHTGIISDIFELIKSKSNIKLESVVSTSKADTFEKIKRKQVDIISATGQTNSNSKYLNFTNNSLYSVPYVFVGKKNINLKNGFNSIDDKKVAVIKNHSIINLINEFRESIQLIKINDIQTAFKQLDENKIDILIINATTAKFYIDTLKYDDLEILYKTIFNLDLKLAVDKNTPIEVLSIIDKSIQNISQQQINDIVHKWSIVKIDNKTDWLFIFKITGIIMILLIVLYINNRKLKSLVNTKTVDIQKQKDELKNILTSLDKNVIFSKTNLKGEITDVSIAFCKISGYKEDELIGESHNIVRHPDMSKETFAIIWKSLKREIPIIKEIKNLKPNGTYYWLESKLAPDYDSKGKLIGYSSISQDITSQKKVEALNKDIEDTQKEVIFTMGSIGESRSQETGNHVKRVALYSKILALHYGLSEIESEMLKQASPMHDIGKVAIPDAILNKPNRFTQAEKEIMDTHALLGFNMLKASKIPLLSLAATVAYEHHEKWDGTGYPQGLKGEEISIQGRITALADIFDALGSDRCYKKAWDDESIFILIKEQSGKQFEPKLVDIFFDNINELLVVRDSLKDISS